MSGTYAVVMGDRGRVVVPAEVREQLGLVTGTPLVLVQTDEGLVLLKRDQAKAMVRRQLRGLDLVGELLAERRRAAAAEDDLG